MATTAGTRCCCDTLVPCRKRDADSVSSSHGKLVGMRRVLFIDEHIGRTLRFFSGDAFLGISVFLLPLFLLPCEDLSKPDTFVADYSHGDVYCDPRSTFFPLLLVFLSSPHVFFFLFKSKLRLIILVFPSFHLLR